MTEVICLDSATYRHIKKYSSLRGSAMTEAIHLDTTTSRHIER